MSGELRDVEYRPQAVTPAWALWLMLVTALSLGAFLAVSLPPAPAQGGAGAVPITGRLTFADAALSMRQSRHAEAYGRFVARADDGEVEAAQMALLSYSFGPRAFDSAWDASPQQREAWTLANRSAVDRETAAQVAFGYSGRVRTCR